MLQQGRICHLWHRFSTPNRVDPESVPSENNVPFSVVVGHPPRPHPCKVGVVECRSWDTSPLRNKRPLYAHVTFVARPNIARGRGGDAWIGELLISRRGRYFRSGREGNRGCPSRTHTHDLFSHLAGGGSHLGSWRVDHDGSWMFALAQLLIRRVLPLFDPALRSSSWRHG